jgi:hypothetical protein
MNDGAQRERMALIPSVSNVATSCDLKIEGRLLRGGTSKCAERAPRSAPIVVFGGVSIGSRLIVAQDPEWPRWATEGEGATLKPLVSGVLEIQSPARLGSR